MGAQDFRLTYDRDLAPRRYTSKLVGVNFGNRLILRGIESRQPQNRVPLRQCTGTADELGLVARRGGERKKLFAPLVYLPFEFRVRIRFEEAKLLLMQESLAHNILCRPVDIADRRGRNRKTPTVRVI